MWTAFEMNEDHWSKQFHMFIAALRQYNKNIMCMYLHYLHHYSLQVRISPFFIHRSERVAIIRIGGECVAQRKKKLSKNAVINLIALKVEGISGLIPLSLAEMHQSHPKTHIEWSKRRTIIILIINTFVIAVDIDRSRNSWSRNDSQSRKAYSFWRV